MAQPETGGARTTEDEGDTLEITIPSQEREDLWKIDIRGEQLENTQREDWLLPTERQTGVEHPPAMEDSVFREAADLPSAVRHRNGTLHLSPGSRIDMKEEDFTPPRGGHQAPEPQGVQSEARAVPKTVPEDNVRNSGKGRRSPIEMLVNTVSHGRHSRQRKCRGSTELLVGNNITKCLRLLCGRMAGTMIQQHCNCFRIWKEMR